MLDPQRLTRDPVFQFNSCIWLVWRSPRVAVERNYQQAGFLLRALGRKLTVMPELRKRFQELGWPPQPPAPDILFRHTPSGKHLVLECKARSFSVDSTTALQARKLLSLCAYSDSCSGAEGPLIVTYVISADDTQLQLKTLQEISAELDQHGLKVADSGTLGISIEDGCLWVTMTMLSPGKHAELALVEGKVKVAEGIDGDTRPLYILPFDPAAAPDQHPDEREYCARQLTERILIFAMSKVGRAAVPDIVSLDPVDAMKQATWNLSDKWAVHEVEQLRRRIEDELYRVLYRGMPDKVERECRKVHVNLVTQEDQRTALSVLQKSVPKNIAERLLDPQLPLPDTGRA